MPAVPCRSARLLTLLLLVLVPVACGPPEPELAELRREVTSCDRDDASLWGALLALETEPMRARYRAVLRLMSRSVSYILKNRIRSSQ